MIGFLSGRVAGREEHGCLLEVSGVGYRLACSATTLSALPRDGASMRLVTYLQVRDDALALYGFATDAEKSLFEALITVAGVGPKVALAVCSAFSPDAFRRTLAIDDVASIASIPGIGKKTAQRILVDLKEKLSVPDLEVVGSAPDALSKARSALENLGYSAGEVRVALGEVSAGPDDGVEEVVRSALKVLAGT
ncbi:MAG: Holliday junction branch migration protein RuvA [Actinomycetota bacterium]